MKFLYIRLCFKVLSFIANCLYSRCKNLANTCTYCHKNCLYTLQFTYTIIGNTYKQYYTNSEYESANHLLGKNLISNELCFTKAFNIWVCFSLNGINGWHHCTIPMHANPTSWKMYKWIMNISFVTSFLYSCDLSHSLCNLHSLFLTFNTFSIQYYPTLSATDDFNVIRLSVNCTEKLFMSYQLYV